MTELCTWWFDGMGGARAWKWYDTSHGKQLVQQYAATLGEKRSKWKSTWSSKMSVRRYRAQVVLSLCDGPESWKAGLAVFTLKYGDRPVKDAMGRYELDIAMQLRADSEEAQNPTKKRKM
jgi:hypothetical protein